MGLFYVILLLRRGYFGSFLLLYIKTLCSQYISGKSTEPERAPTSTGETHVVYYHNQYSSAYKTDERVLKNIIKSNTTCIDPQDSLKVIIYYKNTYTSGLVSKNNQAPPVNQLQQTDLIYEYKCQIGDCEHQNSSYIGLTTTTLSRRLTMHLQSGAPKKHTMDQHHLELTRAMLVDNTRIIAKETNFDKLCILEALYIQKNKPIINNQDTGRIRTLKLYSSTQLPSPPPR